MTTNYRRGYALERRTRLELEADGYRVIRSAGSKGPADLVAWCEELVRFVQVKSGKSPLSRAERERLEEIPLPVMSRVEVWTWERHGRGLKPKVEVLSFRAL